MNAFYEGFQGLVTDEYLEEMQKNRIPYGYDQLADQNRMQVVVQAIEFSSDGEQDGTYDYTAALKIIKKQETVTSSVNGQITIVNQNGKQLVNRFYISPESQYADILK